LFFVQLLLEGLLLASGGDLKLAQELVGHKSITPTQRYAHLSNAKLAEKYAEIFNRRGMDDWIAQATLAA
jgi:site-specific recombinase XerC